MQDLREKLRAATAEDHRRTEARFAAAFADLPDSYGDFLAAHAMAFPAVGRALAAALDWQPWIDRWHALQSDLDALGLATPRALPLAPAASAAEALGMAYVLEGSRLGSALLLRAVPAGLPRAYLAGGHERAPWLRLQVLLQAADPADETAAVAGARAAFRAFGDAAAHLLPVPA